MSFSVFGATSLVSKPCPKCLGIARLGEIKIIAVMPIPDDEPPIDVSGVHSCSDCVAAEKIVNLGDKDNFVNARKSVAIERHVQLVMPGFGKGYVARGLILPCAHGDFYRHVRWLKANKLNNVI